MNRSRPPPLREAARPQPSTRAVATAAAAATLALVVGVGTAFAPSTPAAHPHFHTPPPPRGSHGLYAASRGGEEVASRRWGGLPPAAHPHSGVMMAGGAVGGSRRRRRGVLAGALKGGGDAETDSLAQFWEEKEDHRDSLDKLMDEAEAEEADAEVGAVKAGAAAAAAGGAQGADLAGAKTDEEVARLAAADPGLEALLRYFEREEREAEAEAGEEDVDIFVDDEEDSCEAPTDPLMANRCGTLTGVFGEESEDGAGGAAVAVAERKEGGATTEAEDGVSLPVPAILPNTSKRQAIRELMQKRADRQSSKLTQVLVYPTFASRSLEDPRKWTIQFRGWCFKPRFVGGEEVTATLSAASNAFQRIQRLPTTSQWLLPASEPFEHTQHSTVLPQLTASYLLRLD